MSCFKCRLIAVCLLLVSFRHSHGNMVSLHGAWEGYSWPGDFAQCWPRLAVDSSQCHRCERPKGEKKTQNTGGNPGRILVA